MNAGVEVDVVVIGGGATGAGVLRDLAMRGVSALLVERGDFTSGTSGRYHGLLHSGARYVESDPVSARHCIEENAVLRRIAPATIEPTGGYFVVTPDDPDDYLERFPAACAAAGIDAEPVELDDLFRAEPLLNRQIRAAYRVPDASLEPWELVDANLASAREHGASAHRYMSVIGFERATDDGAVTAVRVRDERSGEERTIGCRAVVSAAGAWAGKIAGLAGARLEMSPGKGSMLILNRRMTTAVINRLAPPGDGDILVPVHTVCILGTTDITVPDPDDVQVTRDEVTALLADGERLVPGIGSARILRAYAGSRPLYDASALEDGQHEESRGISRAHHVIDHGRRDGVDGLWSIVGGKLTTYRLMARDTVDAVAAALGVDAPCRTADEPLPAPASGTPYWLGDRLAALEADGGGDAELICECELVTRGRLTHALDERGDSSLDDLRRTTRLGMGPCQGAFCTPRAAAVLDDRMVGAGNSALLGFVTERFRGTRTIAWGDQLAELWLAAGIFRGTLAVGGLPDTPSSGHAAG